MGLDHVGFTVADLERSIGFYSELLQQPPLARRLYTESYIAELIGYDSVSIDTAFFELPGSTVLELLEYQDPLRTPVPMEPAQPGNAHLCIVVDDIVGECQRLAQSASLPSASPLAVPVGPYRGARSAYLRDPDGFSVQLMQLPPGGPDFSLGDAREENR